MPRRQLLHVDLGLRGVRGDVLGRVAVHQRGVCVSERDDAVQWGVPRGELLHVDLELRRVRERVRSRAGVLWRSVPERGV